MRTKVLVADDDPGMLELVSEAIECPQVAVIRACNGSDLLQRLASQGPFDLIVADAAMPWLSGLQGGLTPLILLTAIADPELDELIAGLGSRARVLHKPFSLDELDDAVSAFLGARWTTLPAYR